MKKLLMYTLFMYSFIRLCSAEELFFFLEDTPVWSSELSEQNIPLTNTTVTRIIKKDAIIKNIPRPVLININGIFKYTFVYINFENDIYHIPANTFTAKDTEEIFDESFLSCYDGPQQQIWINTYFLDAMSTGDRDILKQYEKKLIDYFDNEMTNWYEFGDFEKSLLITQSTISIGGLVQDEFWIKQIKRISSGYCVTLAWNIHSEIYDRDSSLRSMKVHLPERKREAFINLYFILDGDYIDVFYSNNMDGTDKIYCSSFVSIDIELRKQLNGIIQYNRYYPDMFESYNPSKITSWPRRADGSMDYPPPSLATDTNTTEETENTDDSATAEFAKEKQTNKGSGFKIIMIAGIAVLLGGGAAVFVVMKKK
jgi:hypothetical protein